MDFIAGSLVEMVAGLVVGGGAGGLRLVGADRARRRVARHPLAAARRAPSGATATPTRCAAPSATPTTPTASPSTRPRPRSSGCSAWPGWTIDRFLDRRTTPARAAVRGHPAARAVGAVEPAARAAPPTSPCSGRWPTPPPTGASTSVAPSPSPRPRVGASLIAFGGLNWALDGAAAPVAAVLRLKPAMGPAGALAVGDRARRRACRPARSASGTSPSPTRPPTRRRCSRASTSPSRPAPRSPSSARTAPARPPWPSCSAASTTRRPAPSRSTAPTCATSTSTRGASAITAVFQDFIRFELPLRDNVAPAGAPDEAVLAALADAGAGDLAELDTPLAKGYEGGTDLSGGQWQRVALARALCAVRLGAGRGAARRAHRPARRARRGGDLRARAGRHPRTARRS